MLACCRFPTVPFVDARERGTTAATAEALRCSYLVLIYSEEPHEPAADAERRSARDQRREYNAYTQMLRDRGAFVGGDALQPTSRRRRRFASATARR